ncbi:MAG TPA: winged helix DNA-binding domain-containing protein [Acidimicrobiales bacterium]
MSDALGWDQVLGWRVARHRLDAPAGTPVEVASALAGVQAQVASSAHQVLAVRCGSPDGIDVDRLLWTDRALVKTWALRGTLHLLPAAEWAEWVALLRTREWRITPAWVKYHGVTAAELDAVTAAVPEALAAGPLTRDELADRVAELTGHAHLSEQLRSGWTAVFKPAAAQGLLCQGPPRDGNITFVDPARWLGEDAARPAPDPDEAVAALLARFLDAYGPATREDLARWLGVQPKAARLLLARHAAALVEVDMAGRKAWLTPAGAAAVAEAAPAGGVWLLPGFDPYVLAPISHRAEIIPAGKVDAVSRAAGWISPVLLVGGRIAGTWEPSTAKGVTTVTVTPFAKLPRSVVTAARAHLEARYAAVFGDQVRLAVAS